MTSFCSPQRKTDLLNKRTKILETEIFVGVSVHQFLAEFLLRGHVPGDSAETTLSRGLDRDNFGGFRGFGEIFQKSLAITSGIALDWDNFDQADRWKTDEEE